MLALLTSWRGYVLCACLGLACGWLVQGWRMDTRISRMKADQAQQMADAQALARKVEQARSVVINGALNDAQKESQALQAHADQYRSDLERMRAELARVRARNSSSARRGAGLESTDPIGLLADLYERGAADALARSKYADELRIAGLTCERIYDGLTP